MPVADELYLLYQQSKDLCETTISKWEEHFQWLEEVKRAKVSRDQTVVPKTPARKRKVKKENDENFLPPPPKEGVRTSKRAAAKIAEERNKQTLIEISNLNSKLRRPSIKTESRSNISQLQESTLKNEYIIEVSPERKESPQVEKVKEHNDDSPHQKEERSDIPKGETKTSEEIGSMSESKETCLRVSEESKIKKRSIEEHEKIEPVARVTRTKRRKLSTEKENQTKDESASLTTLQLSSNVGESESLHLRITGSESDECPNDPLKNESSVPSENIASVSQPSSRITRSKVRHITTSSTSSPERQIKLKKITNTATDSDDTSSGFHSDQNKAESCKSALSTIEPSNRITRSKVRQKPPAVSNEQESQNSVTACSVKLKNMNKDYHSPRGKAYSPVVATKYLGSPSRNPHLKSRNNMKTPFEIQEVSTDSIEVKSSPGKVVKHTWPEKKIVNTVPRKGKYQTPSPASSSSIKILSNKGIYSSGSNAKTYSQKRGLFSSSQHVIGTKVIGTPTEVNRTKNIISGTSFLTKVQPTRPTREESEERKQDDIRKKREREEETRRKKEELMRLKKEEQKRKNEDRMRRVQEAREARERKAAEERELQEKERKLREERIKEGKRNILAAKKNEEMRQQALRKQMEEEQRMKEEKLKEQKLKEEQKIKEELKRLQQKKEAERIAREAREKLEQERLKELERIAREKKEMEQLRLKESEVKSSTKKLDETYTADPECRQLTSIQTSDPKQSYAMTPVEKQKVQRNNINDYGINDIRSDDSTDEECAPKKEIPLWAKHSQLKKQLFDQEHYPPNYDLIFPANVLLKMPDLVKMFPKRKRSRFRKRTSSAVWNTPPSQVFAHANR